VWSVQHDVSDDVDVVKRLSTVVHETLSSAACHGRYTVHL